MSVYTIPFEGKTIIYRPRRHLAFPGNAALVDYLRWRPDKCPNELNPEIEQFLEAVGFDRPPVECGSVVLGEEDPRPTSLTFHGGGEPTVLWDLMVRAVGYAREADPRMRFSMSSNGVWSPRQREYICWHFSNVSLSMDGLAPVQNR